MENQLTFSFDESDSLAGFRLTRVEIYNWGTFHNKVWALSPMGRNSLLTGEIGSGKSTLVDAITTLLVPANRVSYNKAAGANVKERTLRSYVQGYYKTERSDSGYGARPVALRDRNNFSVILGVFTNTGYLQTVTVAQVFWAKDLNGQPERFFIVADSELKIAQQFSHFGSDIKSLKKNLKSIPNVEIFETFPPYCASFRRRFGIENEQALELFHQTVSMKSVGNLTDFVRTHMLEVFDIEERIKALITHFDDLNRAHEAVLKAKQQIERLKPISADLDKLAKAVNRRDQYLFFRDSLQLYFAHLKAALLCERLQKLTLEHEKLDGRIDQLKEQIAQQQSDREGLKQALAENGGDRIERIKADILEFTDRKSGRLRKSEEYRALLDQLSLPPADSVESFLTNKKNIGDILQSFEHNETEIQNRRTEAEVVFKGLREDHTILNDEIASLQNRRSNIDSRQIKIRYDLCEALKIKEEELPFAGELIQVRPEESSWEGAIERLLHNFGLSLLVPDRLYADVSDWVEKTNLRGRIVYFKTSSNLKKEFFEQRCDSLISKIAIKPESEFYCWLEQELAKRFDYVCCRTMDQFRRERQAITLSGQIKGFGNRHEKDDRHELNDRSRFILGWSNEAKLAILKNRRLRLEEQISDSAALLSDLQEQQKQIGLRKMQLVRLEGFTSFDDIDWKSIVFRIEELEDELKALQESSDIIKTINEQLSLLEATIKEADFRLDKLKDGRSKNEEKQNQAQLQLKLCNEVIAGKEQDAASLVPQLDMIRVEALGEHLLTVETADSNQTKVREYIQGKIDNEDKKLSNIRERLIRNMQDYCRNYPAETNEVDAKIESGPEFRIMLEQLESDDLPRFESRFKALLNENTIREIANFQSQLNRERQDIRERIEKINQSLKGIEYNRGRYIVLEAQENTDIEIRDFRQSLRACTEGSLTGSDDEQYAESKFLQVKQIIDQFRGREGTADLDKKWTRKVTDVRNWFAFAASERWVEDNSEYEHYTDSGGKSGGQKEKLAYTVLAASLAYQFGLEWGEVRSRSFRFVVIDEAFGRGSDESARFGLELFKKLNLQLLIVTPLQKIHIIEPFVSSVGFVYSPEGRESLLRNLTIEEYFAEKEAGVDS